MMELIFVPFLLKFYYMFLSELLLSREMEYIVPFRLFRSSDDSQSDKERAIHLSEPFCLIHLISRLSYLFDFTKIYICISLCK